MKKKWIKWIRSWKGNKKSMATKMNNMNILWIRGRAFRLNKWWNNWGKSMGWKIRRKWNCQRNSEKSNLKLVRWPGRSLFSMTISVKKFINKKIKMSLRKIRCWRCQMMTKILIQLMLHRWINWKTTKESKKQRSKMKIRRCLL